MSNELTKQEYLKRYLENKDSDRKRKKKIKTRPLISRLKIVDQDIDLKSIPFGEKACNEDEDDENPVVAEVIDERPVEMKVKELYESSHWKKFDENSQCAASATDKIFTDDNKYVGQSSSKQTQNSSSGHNYVKKSRHDSDSDFSPPRHQNERMIHKKNYSDNNHTSLMVNKQDIHRVRHDSDSDVSPPRETKESANKKRFDSDHDISPPQETKNYTYKERHTSSSDISPPRSKKQDIRKKRHSSSDISPSHYNSRKTKVSKNYISSPRRQNKIEKRRKNSDSDISPARQNYNKTDRQLKQTTDIHLSEGDEHFVKYKATSNKSKTYGRHRNESRYDSDISPPRHKVSGKSENKPRKTLSGLKAGLQDSETLMKENQDLRKREKLQINMLDCEVSGKNAETVVRDPKTGLKIDLDQEWKIKKEKEKREEERQKKYAEWGKGVEQTQNKMDKFEEDLYEMSKPLARYRDDEDLDERLKNIVHDDDPMAEYIKKKRQKDLPTVPVYSGPLAPPNRFGMLPGYRWDGVDRSNGFEKKYFDKMNSSKAIQEEAYLWSVQNM